jgi:hypothetical protein
MLGLGRPTFLQVIILFALDAGVRPTGVIIFYAQYSWEWPMGRGILDTLDLRTWPTYLLQAIILFAPDAGVWLTGVIIFYAQVTWHWLVRRRISDTLDGRNRPTYLSTDNNIICIRCWGPAERCNNILCPGHLTLASAVNIRHPQW